MMAVMIPVTLMMRAVGPAPLAAVLPVLPLGIIGFLRYRDMKENQRRNSCPACELRLAYRRLGPHHGMLECPSLCGYRRLVGDPTRR